MENHGICTVSVASIRSTHADKSEQLSQLLFGELAKIIDRHGRQWFKVQTVQDKVTGWVNYQHLRQVTPQEYADYQRHFSYSLDLFQPANWNDQFIPLSFGARLPDHDGVQFSLLGRRGQFSGRSVTRELAVTDPEHLLHFGKQFLNAPEQHGGRSPLGIDSAALVQLLMNLANVQLPRQASEQAFLGEHVHFVEEAAAGDLLFFENRAGKIVHSGILNTDGRLLHIWGRGRLSPVDHFGWFDENENRYRHRLRVMRRHLTNVEPIFDLKEQKIKKNRQEQMFLFGAE